MPNTIAKRQNLEPALCTTDYAELLNLQAKEHGSKFAETVLEIHQKRAWRALTNHTTGKLFDSFAEYTEVELGHIMGTRSTVYLALTQAEVSQNVGRKVPATHAAAVKQLPAPAQTEVLEKAAKSAGDKPATAKDVKKAAGDWRRKQPVVIDVPNEDDAKKLKDSLKQIGKMCGDDILRAIERNVIQLTPADIHYMAGLKPDTAVRVAELVIAGRKPKKAVEFLERMPTEKSTVEDLLLYAIAEGGSYTATINGYEIKVSKRRK